MARETTSESQAVFAVWSVEKRKFYRGGKIWRWTFFARFAAKRINIEGIQLRDEIRKLGCDDSLWDVCVGYQKRKPQ